MTSSKVVLSMHSDYIHHVAFDVYGRRMATCSGDRFVRVWDLTDNGDWNLVGEWQAHRGSVTHLSWAHPEFGTLLATCGSDHDAKIWEERTHSTAEKTMATGPANATNTPGGTTNNNIVNNATTQVMQATTTTTTTTTIAANAAFPNANAAAAGSSNLASRWTTKTQLTEARKAVSCLEFAPRHWGLKLATGSADGCVRIYEAVDIMNLAQWPLAATLQCFGDSSSSTAPITDQLGVTCLSWCTGRFEPPTLVVGGSHLSIFRYMEAARSWQPLLQLPSNNPSLHVLDVAWAPNVGRRFHYIASAEDQQLRVYKLSRTYQDDVKEDNKKNKQRTAAASNNSKSAQGAINNNKLAMESVQTFQANAWRCQWNVTGTVLASSGDGGLVQMWKSDFEGNFHNVAQINE